jgi:predicted nucleic acid binding AN1-type Zn finger protein
MAFADVGRHCEMKLCKQQDFLPFKCEFCKHNYCADHRRPNDHNCENETALNAIDDNYVIICPICQSSLSLKGIAR